MLHVLLVLVHFYEVNAKKLIKDHIHLKLCFLCYCLYQFYRYAEVLLSYVKAQNEASGPDPAVCDAVTRVRAGGIVAGGSGRYRSGRSSYADNNGRNELLVTFCLNFTGCADVSPCTNNRTDPYYYQLKAVRIPYARRYLSLFYRSNVLSFASVFA
ncbi:hypothetical protein [Mucilaginibacter defluvii]|uniref:hypothetical protein n=1 Tax=Mucilaginibacter defluvii TaxID=1196019 RepID=UPI0031EA4658